MEGFGAQGLRSIPEVEEGVGHGRRAHDGSQGGWGETGDGAFVDVHVGGRTPNHGVDMAGQSCLDASIAMSTSAETTDAESK
jgi:hypothetical protein